MSFAIADGVLSGSAESSYLKIEVMGKGRYKKPGAGPGLLVAVTPYLREM